MRKQVGSHKRILAIAACGALLALALWILSNNKVQVAHAVTLPSATVRVWNITGPIGFNPDVSVEDLGGLTGHVNTAANPLSIAVACDNCNNPQGPCGLIFWNPATNVFVDYGVTFGFSAGVDINVKGPMMTGPAGTVFGTPTFQPGDTWVSVLMNGGISIYANLKGSNNFRHYAVAPNVRGVKVDQSTGKVYGALDGFLGPGGIVRLDPATNTLTKWLTGGAPHYLAIDASGKVFSAASDSPDVIGRLDPATNTVTAWAIPGGGLSAGFEEVALDGVAVDTAGNVWVAESASNQVGRLNTVTGEFCEFTKTETLHPQQINTTGSGPLLQTFFTEEGSSTDLKGAMSIVTQAEAIPITSPCPIVTPVMSTVTPSTSTASFFDFVRTPRTNTITPLTVVVPGQDGSSASGTTMTVDGFPVPGILRFPMPTPMGGNASARNFPSGMTGVVSTVMIGGFPANSVAGSYQDVFFAGNSAVFLVSSTAILPPPPICKNSCPLTQGFWKNHGSVWPVTSLTLGSQTYTEAELLTILGTPIRGDASLILADQLIAAKLNIANGACGSSIAATIAAADTALSAFTGKLPYNVAPSSAAGQTMTSLAANLDTFNSSTPSACVATF